VIPIKISDTVLYFVNNVTLFNNDIGTIIDKAISANIQSTLSDYL
jgi:hypothetical protein